VAKTRTATLDIPEPDAYATIDFHEISLLMRGYTVKLPGLTLTPGHGLLGSIQSVQVPLVADLSGIPMPLDIAGPATPDHDLMGLADLDEAPAAPKVKRTRKPKAAAVTATTEAVSTPEAASEADASMAPDAFLGDAEG
jgi:hypothetical protein